MKKMITFPLNTKRYFQLAQKALQKGEVNQGADYLKACYEENKNFPLNMMLVSVLMELKQYEEAYFLLQDYQEQYLASEEYFSIYLQCLLERKNFLKAHLLVNQFLLEKGETFSPKYLQYKRIIRQKELFFQSTQKDAKAQREDFVQLIKSNEFENMEKARYGLQLTQKDFFICCQELFLDEEVHSYFKGLLLEELSALKYTKFVYFPSLTGEIHKVNLPKLEGIPAGRIYQHLMTLAKRETRILDPFIKVNLEEELRYYSILLYPFAEDFIPFPKIFYEVVLQKYLQEEFQVKSCEEEKLKKNYENILKLLDEQNFFQEIP